MHVPEHLYYYEQGFLSSYFYALQTPDLSGPSSPYTLPHLRATPITPYYIGFRRLVRSVTLVSELGTV